MTPSRAATSSSRSSSVSRTSADLVKIDVTDALANPFERGGPRRSDEKVAETHPAHMRRNRFPSNQSTIGTGALHKTSPLASILSGLVCGLIFYVFSAVFSAMIFDEAGANFPEAQAVGVGMNTLSAFVGGSIFASLSGCRAVMAGPDITPTVFMVEMAKLISSSLCPDGRTVCPPADRDAIVPTVLAAIWISTVFTGAVFLALGTFKLTSIVGFMPANVTGGFLSCIGYKVMYYAIEVACGHKIKV